MSSIRCRRIPLVFSIIVTFLCVSLISAADIKLKQYKYGSTITDIIDLGDTLMLLSDCIMKVAKNSSEPHIFYKVNDTVFTGKTCTAIAKGVGDTILAGTSNGLAIYTHNTWKLIGTDYIQTLFIDSRGTKWVGTRNSVGICKLNGETLQQVDSVPATIANATITSICEDTAHTIWVGTFNGGMATFDGTIWTSRLSPFPGSVQAMTCWKGTLVAVSYSPSSGHGGLFFWNNGNWQNADSSATGSSFNRFIEYTDLTTDSSGNLVVSLYGEVKKFNGTSWSTYNNNPHDPMIYAIHCDSKGVLWATTGRDVSRCAGNTWEPFLDENSILPSNNIYALLTAGSGDLWVGTYNGLAVKHEETWTCLDTCRQKVSCLAEDAKGTMWIGTDSCIYKYSSAAWTRYNTRTAPFPYAHVTFLSPDDSGRVYVGVYSGPGARGSAFGIFDGTAWTPIKNGTYPYTIFRDSKNAFWIVSDAGLSRYANGKETNYTCIAANLINIAALAEDRLGNIWLASSTAGLLRFDGTKWDTISNILPMSTDYYPSALHCDSSGAIWLGFSRSTPVSGFLTCYRNGTWNTFDYQNSSFPNTPIVCCSQDLQGNLFFGSSTQGIFMLDPQRNMLSSRTTQRSMITSQSAHSSKLLMLNGSNSGKYRTLSNATIFDLKGREITSRNLKNAICVIKPASKK